jgi:excisionase family DNA binding protein
MFFCPYRHANTSRAKRTSTVTDVGASEDRRQEATVLYSVEDVIARTSLGRSKIYELLASGELGSVKVGRRRLVPARALEEFVERLRVGEPRPAA